MMIMTQQKMWYANLCDVSEARGWNTEFKYSDITSVQRNHVEEEHLINTVPLNYLMHTDIIIPCFTINKLKCLNFCLCCKLQTGAAASKTM